MMKHGMAVLSLILMSAVPQAKSQTIQTPTTQTQTQRPVPAVNDGAKLQDIELHMQSDAAHYRAWPDGGVTVRRGVGYLSPFGAAEYYCGRDFPQARAAPFTEALQQGIAAFTGAKGGLFCIYVLADGDIYAYDVTAGTLSEAADGFRAQIVNVVVGGTGAYRGATGIWLGRAESRGDWREVAPQVRVPDVLLKIMQGYIKTPTTAP